MAAGGHSLRDAAPVCATRVAAVAEIDVWLKRARPGELFVSCTGPELVRGPASERARALYLGGYVDLFQRPNPHCAGRDYLLQRTAKPAVGGPADAATLAPIAMIDDKMAEILRILRRHANFGKRCPTDAELAKTVGLPTRNAAAWRIRKLIEAGAIRSDTIESGPEAGWRTVTIVATGRQTMPPPSLASLKASIAKEASGPC